MNAEKQLHLQKVVSSYALLVTLILLMLQGLIVKQLISFTGS